MSVLVDWEITRLLEEQKLVIIPIGEGAVRPNSVDLRLGNVFATYRPTVDAINPFNEESCKGGIQTFHQEKIFLYKFGFLLSETVEHIELPDDVCGHLTGKSGLARLGLNVYHGWVDAGYKGTITLQLTNVNNRPIQICAGMPIAQLVLYKTSGALIPYGQREDSKYQQTRGVLASKYYLNEQV